MKIKFTTLYAPVLALALLTPMAVVKTAAAAGDDAVAAITKLENDSVKADLADDKAFYAKYQAEDWTGGDSSGRWFSKKDMLKMMDDTKNNKMNSEKISELKVRTYGTTTAVATYKDTYDAMVLGEHRTRAVISTDTFVKQAGAWKLVASHSSTAK
jgi:uncharacterized protein (TIGR02246 family)